MKYVFVMFTPRTVLAAAERGEENTHGDPGSHHAVVTAVDGNLGAGRLRKHR